MKQRKAEETRLIILLVLLIVGIAGLLLFLNPVSNNLQAAAGSSSTFWQSELPQIKVQGKVVSLLGQSSVMIQTKSGYRYQLDVGQAKITNSNGRALTYQNLRDFLKVDQGPEVTITGYVAPNSGTPINAIGQTIRFAKPVALPTPTPRVTPTRRPTATPRPTITPYPAN